MSSIDTCCQLLEEEQTSLIQLSGALTILQASILKDVLKTAIKRMKPIQVDMYDLNEVDVSALQLL